MRLDKYLKVSRLIKRRTVAKEICSAGRIKINGRTAKAGSEVKIDDIIVIGFGGKTIEVQVLALAETARVETAGQMYQLINETKKDAE